MFLVQTEVLLLVIDSYSLLRLKWTNIVSGGVIIAFPREIHNT